MSKNDAPADDQIMNSASSAKQNSDFQTQNQESEESKEPEMYGTIDQGVMNDPAE